MASGVEAVGRGEELGGVFAMIEPGEEAVAAEEAAGVTARLPGTVGHPATIRSTLRWQARRSR